MAADSVTLSNLVFFGRHGVNPEETTLGQRFGLDLTIWLDLSGAIRSDGIEDTVSYAKLYKLARAEMEGEPSRLLEHLAGRLLAVLLRYDERIQRVRVKVTKLNPPIEGSSTGEASVTVERDRSWLESADGRC